MGQQWYCIIGEREYGPLDSAKLRALAAHQKLLPTHLVRLAPSVDWTAAANVKGLFRTETAATKPPPPPTMRWFIRVNEKQFGPYTDQQLRQLAARGELRPEHFVRIDGQTAWHLAKRVQGLFAKGLGSGKAVSEANKKSEPVILIFPCPACGRSLRCKDYFAGKSIRCAACNNRITVPPRKVQPSVPQTSSPSPAVASSRTPSAVNDEPVVIRKKEGTSQPAEQISGFSLRKIFGALLPTDRFPDGTDYRPSKDRITFYGPGKRVDLGRGPIDGPLVYATGQKYLHVFDASLIELPLPTSKSAYLAESLPYWPTYHECSPRQRAQYLDWIYSGRKDPSVELGYVFIFFYGLERRILVDGQDHVCIINELVRLMSIYTQSNSFKNYSATLLWLTIFLTAERGGVVDNDILSRAIKATSRWSDDALRYCLGYFALRALPLPVDAAYVLADRDERSVNSVVTKRHADKFRTLFVQRFEEAHPSGFTLPAKHRERKLEYRPASGTLLAARNSPPEVASRTIPAFDHSQRHFGPLATLWNNCVDELRGFDRVSRRADSRKMTGELYESLPPELRTGDHPELPAWQRAISAGMDDTGWPILRVSKLAAIKKIPVRPQLTKKQCEGLLNSADALGIAIEPDARHTGKNYRWDDSVVVFHDSAPATDNEDVLAYRSAALLLQLGIAIAQADDELDEDELGNIAAHLEREFELSPRFSKRLDGLRHLLVVNKSADASISRAVRHMLPLKERELIGRFLITVAAADKRICDKERQALKKVFRGLGIPAEQLWELLAQYEASEAAASAAATIGDDTTPESAPVLDLDRIRAIHEETRRVQDLLHSVLTGGADGMGLASQTVDNDTTVESLVHVAVAVGVASDQNGAAELEPRDAVSNSSLDGEPLLHGIPERYQEFCSLVVTKPTWARSEMSALAREHGLMLNAACEALNEWSTEEFGDWLIEERDAEIIVHKHLLES